MKVYHASLDKEDFHISTKGSIGNGYIYLSTLKSDVENIHEKIDHITEADLKIDKILVMDEDLCKELKIDYKNQYKILNLPQDLFKFYEDALKNPDLNHMINKILYYQLMKTDKIKGIIYPHKTELKGLEVVVKPNKFNLIVTNKINYSRSKNMNFAVKDPKVGMKIHDDEIGMEYEILELSEIDDQVYNAKIKILKSPDKKDLPEEMKNDFKENNEIEVTLSINGELKNSREINFSRIKLPVRARKNFSDDPVEDLEEFVRELESSELKDKLTELLDSEPGKFKKDSDLIMAAIEICKSFGLTRDEMDFFDSKNFENIKLPYRLRG